MVKNEDLANTYSMGIILTMAYAYKPMYTAMATVFYYHEKTKEFWKNKPKPDLGKKLKGDGTPITPRIKTVLKQR